jgi:PAS domain S-box-containing protein
MESIAEREALHVLVIEDSPGDVRLIEQMLATDWPHHYALQQAARLTTGLDALATESFDVILLDLSLPDSRGLDTFLAVQREASQLPIIVLTGYDDETLALQALEQGAQDYLIKGEVNSALLSRALRYAMGRKQAENALRESEARYRKLVEQAGDAIFLVDDRGQIVNVNQRACRMFGYDYQQLLGMELAELRTAEIVGTETRPNPLQVGQEPFEDLYTDQGGRLIAVEVTASTASDLHNGDYLYIVRDVTTRKEAERALYRRNRELALLNRVIWATVNQIEPNLILQDVCGEIAHFFRAPWVLAARVDLPEEELTIVAEESGSASPPILDLSFPISEGGVFDRLVKGNEPVYVRQTETCGLGPLCELMRDRGVLSLLVVPISLGGRVMSAICVGMEEPHTFVEDDLTLLQSAASAAGRALEAAELHQALQRHAEALEETVAERTHELEDALKRARAADEAKSQFLTNVSHELRTPLTNVKLYVDLLERGMPSKRSAYLATVHREVNRLQALIQDLLNISRLDLGQIQPQMRSLDVNELVTTLVSDRRKLFAERQLELQVRTEQLPLIQADRNLLEQVVSNLLTNALNYTPSGGSVQVMTKPAPSNGSDGITIHVEDTGPGIPAKERGHLFERFYRGEASRALGVPGTGLGLAISREIIELHRGSITLVSEVGEGSTFTVWLPGPAPETPE